MNLRQLEYFLVVARAGSFTAAAAELGVAQPTLTKSIRALEQSIGAQLLDRHARGVALTGYGLVLQRHAERVGVQMQDAEVELRSLLGGTDGLVRIGAGPSWLRRLLPEAVAATMRASPALRVSVVGGYDDILLRQLRGGEIDFVVAELPSKENARDLDLEPLTSDTLGVYGRRGHPLEALGAIRPNDLLAYPWVMPPRTTRPQQRLVALFVAADLPPPTIVAETESMAFLLRIVALSDALTFSVSTTLKLPEAEGLRHFCVPELSAVRAAGIIARSGSFRTPAAARVIEELRQLCAVQGNN